MPYNYILVNLLANTDRAVGAIFLDENGETVDLACSEYTPYQMRVEGAYVGIYLRQARRVAESNDLEDIGLLHLEKKEIHLYARPLPEGYCVVLVQRRPGSVGLARRNLEEAAEDLRRELFERL